MSARAPQRWREGPAGYRWNWHHRRAMARGWAPKSGGEATRALRCCAGQIFLLQRGRGGVLCARWREHFVFLSRSTSRQRLSAAFGSFKHYSPRIGKQCTRCFFPSSFARGGLSALGTVFLSLNVVLCALPVAAPRARVCSSCAVLVHYDFALATCKAAVTASLSASITASPPPSLGIFNSASCLTLSLCLPFRL